MSANDILRDTAYTLNRLAEDGEDIVTYDSGYWHDACRCRGIAEANADYVREFIKDTLAADEDLQVFVLDQLARIVEYYKTRERA